MSRMIQSRTGSIPSHQSHRTAIHTKTVVNRFQRNDQIRVELSTTLRIAYEHQFYNDWSDSKQINAVLQQINVASFLTLLPLLHGGPAGVFPK